jgi:hypothetical protein
MILLFLPTRTLFKTNNMKKLFTLLIVFCVVLFCGTATGQNTEKNKNDKKGGFSVGGYDQTRKAKAPSRSINIPEETEKAEKSVEAEKVNEDVEKAMAPAPAVEAKEAPASAKPKVKEKGKTAGKASGQRHPVNTKSTQKPKDDPKNIK